MRTALTAAVALTASLPTAHAQAPRPLPSLVVAHVGLPGATPARVVSLTLALGPLPWTILGCVSRVAGTCFPTQRVPLTEADRAELVVHIQDVQRLGRCAPEAALPGDPDYMLGFPAALYAGHLPADPRAIAARTIGPCSAPSRLAWWLAERFTAGTGPATR